MRLLFLMPTIGRWLKVQAVLDKYYSLSTYHDTHFLISCNATDRSMNNATVIQQLLSYPNLQVMFPNATCVIEAFNALPGNLPWDILAATSDDMVPLVKGYDSHIVEAMQKHYPDTDGMLFFNDGYQRDAICTLPIIGHEYYARFGYVFYPEYKYLWADVELTDVARRLGRCRYIDTVLLEHQHPNWGYPSDPHYRYSESFNHADERVYRSRQAIGFGLE